MKAADWPETSRLTVQRAGLAPYTVVLVEGEESAPIVITIQGKVFKLDTSH